jgi:hypothetical protein
MASQEEIQLTSTGDNESIRYLKQALVDGQHWYITLLQAIALWNKTGEIYEGRTYLYIIDDEAFDWLLLAERLCATIDGLLPEDEKNSLLFHGKPPLEMTAGEFKKLIGSTKYHQYLNYFYGVTVEEALLLAVQEEVRKERRVSGYTTKQDTTNEAYRRIYGSTRTDLLKNFRQDKNYPQRRSITITELKEFTYWLFKYRLKHCDKARVASDTKKALDWLNESNGLSRRLVHEKPPMMVDQDVL